VWSRAVAVVIGVAVAGAALPGRASAEDKVVLLDGTTISGGITAETDKTVSIRTRYGMSLTVKLERVRSITTAAGERIVNEPKSRSAPKPNRPTKAPAESHRVAKDVLEKTGVQGGLIVQIGCGDGTLTAALCPDDRYLVHGLETDPTNVGKARAYIRGRNLYGRVSVEHWTSKTLPYADGLVNLVVSEDLGRISKDEVMRVLCPNGVALIRGNAGWTKTVKPRPKEMGEWTHTLCDAGSNLLCEDTLLGPPTDVQWLTGTQWVTGGRKSSTFAVVVSSGRIFHLTVNALPNMRHRHERERFVLARDAYNGVLLWRKKGFGGTDRIAAATDRLYVVQEKRLVALDGATGQTVAKFKQDDPHTVLYRNGVLVAASSTEVSAFSPATTARIWRHTLGNAATGRISRGTGWYGKRSGVIATDDGVVFLVGKPERNGLVDAKIICLDLRTGSKKWETDFGKMAGEEAQATIFGVKDFIAVSNRAPGSDQSAGNMYVLSAKDGRKLWRGQAPLSRPRKHFFDRGRLWINAGGKGVDPLTGNVTDGLARIPDGCGKNACQPLVATPRYVIKGRFGLLMDRTTGKNYVSYDNVRSACGVGAIPSNGMLYMHQHGCNCREFPIRGEVCLTSIQHATEKRSQPGPLEEGPALGKKAAQTRALPAQEWPMFRHDQERSGSTASGMQGAPEVIWKAHAGLPDTGLSGEDWKMGALNAVTPPVVAGRRVVVAVPQTHSVCAFAVEGGKPLWRYTASGPVAYAPVLYDGMCVFGGNDGRVYCVSMDNGTLMWRRRIAPRERRIVAHGQLESAWPVHGLMDVQDGILGVQGGRSEGLGGVISCQIRVRTGEVLRYTSGSAKQETSRRDKKSGGDFLDGGLYGFTDATRVLNPNPQGGARMLLSYGSASVRRYRERLTASMLVFDSKTRYGVKGARDGGRVLFADGGHAWSVSLPSMQVEAMVLAGQTIHIAGPKDRNERDRGYILRSYDASRGTKVGEITLPGEPAFDGMAAAYGRLFVSLQNGQLLCLGARE
jgi:outer membrane protein assembly factor BamB